jgi:hypothetical protein
MTPYDLEQVKRIIDRINLGKEKIRFMDVFISVEGKIELARLDGRDEERRGFSFWLFGSYNGVGLMSTSSL